MIFYGGRDTRPPFVQSTEIQEDNEMDRLEQFLNFAEQSPTAFHAAAGFR